MKPPDLSQRINSAIRPDRLLDLAVKLVEVPSPTRDGKAVADRLAAILAEDGFAVERPDAGWPQAPAVVARYDTGRPGRTLQFNGHLDTVHLPFVPPRVEAGILYGSGASDMKGGMAAMCEAMRALRDADAPAGRPHPRHRPRPARKPLGRRLASRWADRPRLSRRRRAAAGVPLRSAAGRGARTGDPRGTHLRAMASPCTRCSAASSSPA